MPDYRFKYVIYTLLRLWDELLLMYSVNRSIYCLLLYFSGIQCLPLDKITDDFERFFHTLYFGVKMWRKTNAVASIGAEYIIIL